MKEKLFVKKLHKKAEEIRLVWLHGWGVDHSTLISIASGFVGETENYLIDLPGFGRSKTPDYIWGVDEYMTVVNNWLKAFKTKKPTYIIGHSFGGKIALKLAESYPNQVDGIVLIAASGLKRKRSLYFKIKFFAFRVCSKIVRKVFGEKVFAIIKKSLASRVGSADYRASEGVKREILIKTIRQYMNKIASKVKCPTLLIYGGQDDQTPPEFGQKYNKLIKNSKYLELPNLNHYTILSEGQYQVQNFIKQFIKGK